MTMNGIWTALITPFHADGSIDYEAYRKIIRHQIEGGVEGLVPCGTTGESPTLAENERKKLIEVALEETQGTSLGVAAGTGSNNTAATVEFSRWASDRGVWGVLVVAPYYNKPTQRGLDAHFRAVADAVDCEVVPYNIVGRTAVRAEIPTLLKLAEHPRIGAVKESCGLDFTCQLLDVLKEKGIALDVLSGDDPTFYYSLRAGAVGCVSVAANLIPKEMVELHRAHTQGNEDLTKQIQEKLALFFEHEFLETSPAPIKYAMHLKGFCENTLRLPMVPLEESHQETLSQTLKKLGVL